MANMAAKVVEKEQALAASYQQLEQLAREQEEPPSARASCVTCMTVWVRTSVRHPQLQSGRASNEQMLQTLRESLDQLKLSIDAMNLPRGDITALLANLRYRLEPRFKASDIELQWMWIFCALGPARRQGHAICSSWCRGPVQCAAACPGQCVAHRVARHAVGGAQLR